MIINTREISVLLMLVMTTRAWPTARPKSNTTAWQATGDALPQASGVITSSIQITPSPRSFNGEAADQTLIPQNPQFSQNYFISRGQAQNSMRLENNPPQVSISVPPNSYTDEQKGQMPMYEIPEKKNEQQRHLPKNRINITDTRQHVQPDWNEYQSSYNPEKKNYSRVYISGNENSDKDRLNLNMSTSNNRKTSENDQYMRVDLMKGHSQITQSVHIFSHDYPEGQPKFVRKQVTTAVNPREISSILAQGLQRAAQDENHTDLNYSYRSQILNIASKPSTRHENFSMESLPQNSSFREKSYNLKPNFQLPMAERSYEIPREYENRSYSGDNLKNKPILEMPSYPAARAEVQKTFPLEEEILVRTNEETYNKPRNLTVTPQGRIVTLSSYKKNQSSPYKANNTSMDGSGSKIVFPGEMENSAVTRFKPDVNGRRPKCADEYSFCENAEEYPQDYVRSLIENDASLGPGFRDFVPIDLGTRIQPDEQVFLCASREQIVYPKMAQNKDDKWLFVVNHDSYVQGVRIEKCERQEACSFAENFPSGYVTSCQQKYIYRKLLALGEDGKPTSDSFRLPSCCSCVITKQFPAPRMGGKSTPDTSRKRRRT